MAIFCMIILIVKLRRATTNIQTGISLYIFISIIELLVLIENRRDIHTFSDLKSNFKSRSDWSKKCAPSRSCKKIIILLIVLFSIN